LEQTFLNPWEKILPFKIWGGKGALLFWPKRRKRGQKGFKNFKGLPQKKMGGDGLAFFGVGPKVWN